MTSVVLALPLLIGQSMCGYLSAGYSPEQAMHRGIRDHSELFRHIPNTDTARTIGKAAFRSSYEQCPQQWERHRTASTVSPFSL